MESTSYPGPRLIFWETTAGCNLRCIHMTGDYLGEEPFCTYLPHSFQPSSMPINEGIRP